MRPPVIAPRKIYRILQEALKRGAHVALMARKIAVLEGESRFVLSELVRLDAANARDFDESFLLLWLAGSFLQRLLVNCALLAM